MVWNVWVLDFVRERWQDTSPGDFESTFIEAGDSEAKEGLKVEDTGSEQQEWA